MGLVYLARVQMSDGVSTIGNPRRFSVRERLRHVIVGPRSVLVRNKTYSESWAVVDKGDKEHIAQGVGQQPSARSKKTA